MCQGVCVALILQPNGKIVFGDNFTQANGLPRRALARLNVDGTLDGGFCDLAFSADAGNPNGSIFGLAAQADGKLLATGAFTLVDGQPRKSMARVVTGNAVVTLAGQASGSDPIVTWTRNVAGPELAHTPILMHSTDGLNYTTIGAMTRIATGWQATGSYAFNGPPFYLLATGFASSDAVNGSTGRVDSPVYSNDRIFKDGFE